MANPLSLRSKSLTLPPVQLQHINQRQPFSQVVTPGLKREEEGEGQEERNSSPALNTSNLSYFPVTRSAAYSRIPASSEEGEGELPTSSSKKHSTRLRVIRIHPIALLPAFILGIITSLYVCLQDSSSPSWSKLIFKQQQFNIKTEPVINHRDHIYLPYDYLNHTWTLNPSKDQYPILQLIHNASLAWHDKLNRQKEISEETPKGFLEWFNRAQENQVKLVDEFDRVNELIEPFWAIPPTVLRNRTEEADVGRTIDQLKLLEVIVPHLPDVNVTMSHHDGPSVFMDWKTKQRHLDHARAGKDRVEDDASLWGFVGACSPDSPMRMLANGLGQELKVQHAGPGGYIGLDHSKTMDLCQLQSGKNSWFHSMGRTETITATTDLQVRLHRLGVASKHPYGHQLKRRRRRKEYSLAQLSDRYLSASFVGDLVQCTVEDSSCETISKEIEFADPVDWQFQNNFKYVLDVDGNSWSGRFRRLLKSNSLVFKSTIWPEWYRDQIQPWYHYIPVRIDYDEIFDLMSFFTGAPSDDQKFKTEGFDHLAKSIAQNGSLWLMNTSDIKILELMCGERISNGRESLLMIVIQ
ncbi:hypothetical protein KEM48_006509 [Puccinia striiformis f. sp. tritici PST-130]|nr:hypothetical protein KEM48_006509 [Puccinia striiformis f. sp. tritici PST-130]